MREKASDNLEIRQIRLETKVILATKVNKVKPKPY